MSEVTIFAVTLFGAGLLFIGLGVPLFQRRVPRNFLYGCRTNKTLSDETIWYAVNRVTGKWLILGGAVMTATAVGLFMFRKSLNPGYAAASLIALLTISTAVMVVSSLRAQKRF